MKDDIYSAICREALESRQRDLGSFVDNGMAGMSTRLEKTLLRLPSNYADLSYGHKAWTSRPRGNSQPYEPTGGLRYPGDPADETAVRAFVNGLFGG